jgi:hypothetical protein
MTVSATSYAPLLYNGNGATTEFAVTFTFADSTDLIVTHIDASDTETIWAESTNYTVTGGDGSTGTVTVSTSPTDYTPASGEQLRIERSTPNSQPEDFDFDNQVTEDSVQSAIDRLARVNQELTYNNDRRPALSKAAFASFGGAIEFPAPSAGAVISWNAGATALVNVDLIDLDGVAISNLTTTASLENSDLFPLYDDSAGNNTAITRGNLVTSVLGSDLEAIKGLTSAANKLPYYTGSGTAALADLTAAGRSLLDDADAGAQRTTLGVTSTTDLASTDNAKGASLIGIEDSSGNFTSSNVEGAIAELSSELIWVHIGTENLSGAVSSIDRTNLSAYKTIKMTFDLKPATDDVVLYMRLSDDDGSTFETANYAYTARGLNGAGSVIDRNSNSDGEIHLISTGCGSGTGESVSGHVLITNLNQAEYTKLTGLITFYSASGTHYSCYLSGAYQQQIAIDGIRLLFASGNVADGYVIYEGVE